MIKRGERQVTKDETLSLFTFQKRETLISLMVALFVSLLVLLLTHPIKEPSSGPRCVGTFYWVTILSVLIPSFLVSFWGAIGLIRFFRNDQRRLGQISNLTRLEHLSFLLPGLTLLAIFWAEMVGLIIVGVVAFLLLVVTFATTPRQSLGVHVLIIPGNTLFSAAVLTFVFLAVMISASLCWFFNF